MLPYTHQAAYRLVWKAEEDTGSDSPPGNRLEGDKTEGKNWEGFQR